jgi:hypothetical protein
MPPGVGPGYLGGNPSMYDERPSASGLS